MRKKALLNRFQSPYTWLHKSVYVFLAFALIPILNTVNPPIAFGQVSCDPWFSVGGWTGTFTQTGTGSGQTGNVSIVNNESVSGTVTFDQAPSDCLDGQYWTGVLNADVDIVREWQSSCPAGSNRPVKTSTWRANGPLTAPAYLAFWYYNPPEGYTFYSGGSINGSVETKDCDGTDNTLSVPLPWNLWPEMRALPPSGLILTIANDQIQRVIDVPMNYQQSWNLTPSGQPSPPHFRTISTINVSWPVQL